MSETQVAELEVPRFVPANFGEEPSKKPEPPRAPQRAAGERPRSPINGQPIPMGRAKGTPNKVTQTLREAVERAARDCHPQGLAGWLVERAQGGVQDRQIFAGLVGKVIPIQVNQAVSGGISINLGWLGGRGIGTVSAQPKVIDAQTLDLIENSGERRWIADGHTDAGHAPEAVGAAQTASGYPGTSGTEIAQPEPIQGQGGGVFDSGQPPTPHPPSNPAGGV
jgi:hypothetical protein